jgi:CPA2 family monovalent cation:H+ antiporter-2
MQEGGEWLRELLLVLATAGIVVPLFGRLRFGIVPGFILAGVVLGPSGFGRLTVQLPWLHWITFSDPERVAPLAELGVLFLLFTIGLEFSIDRLWKMRRLVLGLGSAQFLASAAILFVLAAWIAGSFTVGLVAGMALALSSTAIATQVLIESRRFTRPVGRASLGVLLFQDLMVVPIVLVIGLLGGEHIRLSWAVIGAIGLAVAVLAAIIFAGRYLVRPLLKLAAATESRELIIAIALFLAVGAALLTQGVGLSSALGAFLAGVLLGESQYRHQLDVDIEPFKGLLLGLFFMTVGMSVDLVPLLRQPLLFVGAIGGVALIKVIVAALAGRALALGTAVAIETAFVLAGAGEFALIVFNLAGRSGVLDGSTEQYLTAMAAAMMIAIPLLAALGRRAAGLVQARKGREAHGVDGVDDGSFSDHVVVGGFGRVGQTVARVLDSEQIPYVAVDLNAELVEERRAEGREVFYGDASRQEILQRIGGAEARAFVVTPDKPDAAETMVRAIRAVWPLTPIHARALDPAHAERLAKAGATSVVPEALEGSLQLAGRVLAELGLPDDTVDARLDQEREAEIKRLGAAR